MMNTIKHAKKVVEIGCGHGLIGVLVGVVSQAELTMQDFNQDVLEQLTKPTI